MAGRLQGRAAIVTGASRGLGRATALALAAEGAAVAVVARTENQWDERLPGTIGDTVSAIESAGGRAVAIRADLLEPADIPRLVEEARDALGPITILVNNAAFTAPGRPPAAGAAFTAPGRPPAAGAAFTAPGRPPAAGAVTARPPKASPSAAADWPGFLSVPLSAYRRHFDIGPFAAYELMQRVCPDMIAAGRGGIVNVTSVASRVAALPGYGGSKAALEHLTLCAGRDLLPHNITVAALAPSRPIATPGLVYYRSELANTSPEDEFARAATELVLADPATVSGRTIGHLQVLDCSYTPFGEGTDDVEQAMA